MITKDLFGRILPRIVYSRVHSGEKKKRGMTKYLRPCIFDIFHMMVKFFMMSTDLKEKKADF